jgi:hypothetical protein
LTNDNPSTWPPDGVVRHQIEEAVEIRNLLKIQGNEVAVDAMSTFIKTLRKMVQSHQVYLDPIRGHVIIEEDNGDKWIVLHIIPEAETDDTSTFFVKDYNRRDYPEPKSYNQYPYDEQGKPYDVLKRYPYIKRLTVNSRTTIAIMCLLAPKSTTTTKS